MLMDKSTRGQVSITRSFIFALVTMFGLGIYYFFLVEYAFLKVKITLTNILTSTTLDPSVISLVTSRYDQLYVIMKFLPFAFVFVIIIWLFIVMFRTERDVGY